MRISSALAFVLIAAASFAQKPASDSTAAPASSSEQTQSKPQTKKPPADPQGKPKPIPPEDLSLYPAQRLSAVIEADAWRMRRDLHAVGMATLGAAWWKQDRGAAEHWIYPAVDEVTIASQDESDTDRVRRLEAMRRVLGLVTALDAGLRERLKDAIKFSTARDNDRHSTVSQGRTADALVLAAQNASPPESARSISEALQYGVTEMVVRAILSLDEPLPDEADRLFGRSLDQAMNSGDVEQMRAFTALMQDAYATDIPAEWRRRIVDAYARVISNRSGDYDARCALAGAVAGSTEDFGGDIAGLVSSTRAECVLGISDPVLAADAQALQRADPKTSDDYLAVAGQSRSPTSRYTVKLIAAEKAEKEDIDSENGGPVRSLRIFDAMTTEERAVKPGAYRRLRAEEAIKAALFTLGKSGCSPALRIVDNSPRETILHIAIAVAEKLTPPCYRDGIDIALRQIRMRGSTDDPNDYIRMINLVVRRGPYPEQSLQEVLRAMDGWKEKDPKTLLAGEPAYQAPWNNLLPLAIVPDTFNIAAERLSAIGRCCYRNDLLRTDFELFLVRGFLDRYAREAAKQKEEMKAEGEKP